MEGVNDVMNQIVQRVPRAKPINVKNMEVAEDVMNYIVLLVLRTTPVNV